MREAANFSFAHYHFHIDDIFCCVVWKTRNFIQGFPQNGLSCHVGNHVAHDVITGLCSTRAGEQDSVIKLLFSVEQLQTRCMQQLLEALAMYDDTTEYVKPRG